MHVRILIKMVDSCGVERAGPSDYSVDFIILLQQIVCQVRSILSRNACNQSSFHLICRHLGTSGHRNDECSGGIVNGFFAGSVWRLAFGVQTISISYGASVLLCPRLRWPLWS